MSYYHGPLPDSIWLTMLKVWTSPVAIQGDFARSNAEDVALAASLGWISTVDPNGLAYRRSWRITVSGLSALHNKELMQ